MTVTSQVCKSQDDFICIKQMAVYLFPEVIKLLILQKFTDTYYVPGTMLTARYQMMNKIPAFL